MSKKLFTASIFALLIGIQLVFATTLLYEDFEGSTFPPPTGWTTTATGNCVMWGRRTTGQIFDLASAGCQIASTVTRTGTSILVSPALNFNSTSTETLNFYFRCPGSGAAYGLASLLDTMKVEISTDGGINWTPIRVMDSAYIYNRLPTQTSIYKETLNLSAYNGQTNVSIRWILYRNYAGIVGVNRYFNLDSVYVYDQGGVVPQPFITNITRNPIIPLMSEPVRVTAKIYDPSYPLPLFDTLFYHSGDTAVGPWQTVLKDSFHLSDSIHFYTIPVQDTGTIVFYRIAVTNSGGVRTLSSTYSYQVAFERSIYQIQYVTGPSDTSPDFGKWVHTQGIVTGVLSRYFYMEENPGGAWHGFFVRRQLGDSFPIVSVGDSVDIVGKVDEFQGTSQTREFYTNGARVQVLASGIPVPCTTLTTISQVAESLEDALVRFNYLHFKATGTFGSGVTYYLYNQAETESIAIYIWSTPFSYIPGFPIPTGPIAVIAHLYQYINIYELVPRVYTDFIPIPAPTEPTLLAPANGSSSTNRLPLFDWADVPFGIQYQIQLASDDSFSSPILDTTISASQFQTIVELSYGSYYWRVRAEDEINRLSSWSAVWNFRIGALASGWMTMANIPTQPSDKHPKAGSCMAALDGKIYFLKASNTQDFAMFTPDTGIGSWALLETIPLGLKANGDGKRPKKGASLATFDNAVYALRGNNTPGFWKYVTDTTETLGWKKLANIPTGAKNPKDASGLTSVTKGSNPYIFAMKGSKTDEFYLYDIAANTWSPALRKPPTGPSGKIGYKKGSCLAYDGRYVYVMKGTYGDFFKYDPEADTWIQLRRYDSKVFINAAGKKKKIGEGAGLAFWYDNIYLQKGGNTVEYWKYTIATDTWTQMLPDSLWSIPLGPTGKKKVKGGGALAVNWTEKDRGEGEIYVSKGANTDEFYKHEEPAAPPIFVLPNNTNQGTMGKTLATGTDKLTIAPNPAAYVTAIRYSLPTAGPVNFKLYNVTGVLIKSYAKTSPTKDGVLMIDTKELPAGVYVLRFNSGNIGVTRKLVIQK
jgi:hypothetical protein